MLSFDASARDACENAMLVDRRQLQIIQALRYNYPAIRDRRVRHVMRKCYEMRRYTMHNGQSVT